MKLKHVAALGLSACMCVTLCACEKKGPSDAGDYAAEDAVVWCAPGSERILATQDADTYADVRSDRISLSAAKNDYESAQIIVTASKDLAFTVSLSDLVDVSDPDNVIGHENFTVYTQKYVDVTRNWHNNGAPTGAYPDAIIPQETAAEYGLNKVKQGKNGGAWLEYYIPSDAAAGNYQGTATVRIGQDDVTVPVSLKVWNVTIPQETTSKSLFSVNMGQVAVHELDSSIEMVDKYTELLIRYKLSPTGAASAGTSTAQEFADKAYELVSKGLTTIGLPSAGNYTYNGVSLFDPEVVGAYIVALAEKSLATNIDLLSKAAFYDWYIDEPFFVSYADGVVEAHLVVYDRMIDDVVARLEEDAAFDGAFGRQLIESVKSIAHVITDYGTDENGNSHRTASVLKKSDGTLLDYGDYKYVNLCPKPDGYGSAEERASYSAYGRETWWYNCNTPSYPYVSYHLDDTLTSAVMVGWMMADYDLTGDLYWAVNYHYAEGANLEDPYSTAHRGSGANGDGFLVYPGKTYGLDEPVASIRLDAIRDGREDYELIKILKDLYGAKGYSADPVIGMMTSKLYSDSSVLGGSAEYEAAREILLSLVETATSSAAFMITSLERTETAQGTSFTIQAIAAPDAKLYAGDAQLLPENGVYTVTKSLTEQENYYAVRIVAADGTEHALSLYLGGKEQVFLAETFAEGDFGGDILSREFSEEGYLKLTLGNDAGTGGKLSFDLLHESIGEISASTANYTIELYNEQDEAVPFEVQIEYEGYGLESALIATLVPGVNTLDLDFFATLNWNNRGKISRIRIVLTDCPSVGVGNLRIYGV